MIPVILAGGSGTRLWPLSRGLFPKQFLALNGDRTMLQETLGRLDGLPNLKPPMIVCNDDHRFIAAEQLRQSGIEGASILLEPVARNTAPAICVAAMTALDKGADSLLLVLPADHVIRDISRFHHAIAVARQAADGGALVTFGIKPGAPETGYGYIKACVDTQQQHWPLDRFVEKPDHDTAVTFLETGQYFWNSGMFMFKASVYLAEVERHAPQMVKACRGAVDGAKRDLDFLRLSMAAFSTCPSNSIDYAVMEKTERARVVPLDAGWSDVGSWSALWGLIEKDDAGNACKGDVVAVDSRNSYLHSANGRLVAALGVNDIVVVDTSDAVLVAHKDRVQDVKRIVERLIASERKEAQQHRIGFRPWGTYDSIDQGNRYQVKHITVKPGAKLSVQKHYHRAEHWVVVSGTAKVRNGDTEILLTENQSTYIPIGAVHSLENPGKVPLQLIEVQSGTYLGEDDIVRFEDRYGRIDVTVTRDS